MDIQAKQYLERIAIALETISNPIRETEGHTYDEKSNMHFVKLAGFNEARTIRSSKETTALIDMTDDGTIVGFEIFGIKKELE